MTTWVPMDLEDGVDLSRLAVDRFPVASHFEIEFFRRSGMLAMRYRDEELGVLAEFSWWDSVDRELRNWTLADVPLGTLERPYSDVDQSWRILIWRNVEYVFIVQGDDDAYQHGSRVPAGLYLAEWDRALAVVSRGPN